MRPPPPSPPLEHSALALAIYCQITNSQDPAERAHVSTYPDMSTAEQIRKSLERQRAHGVSFRIAWKQALGHLLLSHEPDQRNVDRALLTDASVIRAWQAGYLRQSHRGLDAIARLTAALEPDDETTLGLDRRRHPETARGLP
jgi:hypothetical protein